MKVPACGIVEGTGSIAMLEPASTRGRAASVQALAGRDGFDTAMPTLQRSYSAPLSGALQTPRGVTGPLFRPGSTESLPIARAQPATAVQAPPRYAANDSVLTKLKCFARVYLTDRGYTTAFAMMVLSQLGEGLMVGGFLMLIESLGIKAAGGVAPALIIAILEVCVGAAAIPAAASNSERCRTSQALCARQLVKGAAVDLAVGVAFLGVAGLAVFLGVHAWPLVVAAAGVRVIQLARRSFRTNAWNGVKLRVMQTKQAREARDMRRIVSGAEAGAGMLAFGVGSLCAFQVAMAVLPAMGPAILITALVCIGVGVLLSAVPKLYFLKYAKPS